MAEYTPTTDEVRERFIDGAINRATATGFSVTRYIIDKARADFDRWLTEVRREAWDEVADYHDRTNAPDIAESTRRDNPYRKKEATDE